MTQVTMEWLRERCRAEGKHLIWMRSCSNSTDPRAGLGGKIINVRREAWALAHGRTPRANHCVETACEHELCVLPACMVEVSRSVVNSRRRLTLAGRARFAAAVRARSKVTPDIAAAVRASNDSSYVEARRHNLHPTTVQAIRRGDTWRDFSSPEVQLQLMQQRKQA